MNNKKGSWSFSRSVNVNRKFNAWSYTRISDYLLCPLKAQLKHLKKIEEPKTEPLFRGIQAHEQIEVFLKGGPKPSMELHPAALSVLVDLRKHLEKTKQNPKDCVELSWVLKKDWTTTHAKDWNGAWLRAKVDAIFWDEDTCHIVDWKTGKYREEQNEEYQQQLELYALLALTLLPRNENTPKDFTVRPALYYVDHGIEYSHTTFTLRDLPKLRKVWLSRIKPMMNDSLFAPRPNSKCKWCHYGSGPDGIKLCKYS